MGRYWIGLGALLVLAYAALPYVTIWQLNQAVNARDVAALNEMVDWASLRGGLAYDLESQFEPPQAASDDPMEEAAGNLLGIFTDMLIGPIADFYASPQGLIYLLNGQVILDDPGEALEEDFPAEESWFDHIRFAFFGGPGQFKVWVDGPAPRGKGADDTAPMVLEFRLQNFRWQLTRVHLPLDGIAE